MDWAHGVGSSNPLGVRFCWMLTHSLAQASNLIGLGLVPCWFVIGIAEQLPMLEELAGVVVED